MASAINRSNIFCHVMDDVNCTTPAWAESQAARCEVVTIGTPGAEIDVELRPGLWPPSARPGLPRPPCARERAHFISICEGELSFLMTISR
mmetsp:Transcript_110456/g.356281  ORF Transcript_110456/g.356281 Transcript_110456/m.356281 type:complete len:91 (+) Transcript_110456:104-376(+)